MRLQANKYLMLPKDIPPLIWNFSKDKLPNKSGRYLGWCFSCNDNDVIWRQVVDVHFDPCIGWTYWWNKDKGEPICVIKWMEYPFEIVTL